MILRSEKALLSTKMKKSLKSEKGGARRGRSDAGKNEKKKKQA